MMLRNGSAVDVAVAIAKKARSEAIEVFKKRILVVFYSLCGVEDKISS